MRLVSSLFGLALLATPVLATAQTMSKPATPPAAAVPMAPTSPAKPMSSTTTATSSSGVMHYSSMSEATSKCGSDTVVWASPRSKALHTSDSKHFGKTKSGFYTCERDAMAGGYHMAGTSKKHAKAG